MSKFLLLSGAILLIPNVSFAQNFAGHPSSEQCQLIRQAVAQYGYAAARQRALENYGVEAVRFGEQCFNRQARRLRGHEFSASAVEER